MQAFSIHVCDIETELHGKEYFLSKVIDNCFEYHVSSKAVHGKHTMFNTLVNINRDRVYFFRNFTVTFEAAINFNSRKNAMK